MDQQFLVNLAVVLGLMIAGGVLSSLTKYLWNKLKEAPNGEVTMWRIQRIADVLVKAAEQKIDDNGEKKRYVTAILENMFPNMDRSLIDGIIEAAVYELKQYDSDPNNDKGI